MSKRWIGSIAALALLLASASAVAGAFSKTYERIPGWDGAQMGALVLVPQGQGAGPFPLIVMPASWSLPNLEYLGRAATGQRRLRGGQLYLAWILGFGRADRYRRAGHGGRRQRGDRLGVGAYAG